MQHKRPTPTRTDRHERVLAIAAFCGLILVASASATGAAGEASKSDDGCHMPEASPPPAAKAGEQQPSFACASPIANMPDVWQTKPLLPEWEVRNTGKAPLVIKLQGT